MEKVLERFMRYCAVKTDSKQDVETIPSTERQWDLAKILEQEMRDAGLSNVYLSEYCYVYGEVPANAEGIPAIAFIAHMDTVKTDKPPVPTIKMINGVECVASDGTTILGADDKAGIAEIMSMAEYYIAHPEIRHGKIGVCFTPDEEVGHGPVKCDLKRIGCDFGYTVDGGPVGYFNYENFNAADAKIKIKGVAAHTGEAKGALVNAADIATQFQAMLPAEQKPEYTQGYESFYFLYALQGDMRSATSRYLLRAFDEEGFAKEKETIRAIADLLNRRYGEGTVEVEITDNYKNMRAVVEKNMDIVEIAKKAYLAAGVEPKAEPIRGGTDGANISWMGMPCPNLSTGGSDFHGLNEHIPVAALSKMVEVLVGIVRIAAEKA